MKAGGRLGGKLLLAAISSLVTVSLLAAGGELVVRYRERHRTSVPGTMPLLFYRHERLLHALARNADYFGWVHVNGQGFRGAGETKTDAGGAFRIMAVGASTTFDSFVTQDEKARPAQLEAWLQARVPGRRIEVINAGVPGYLLLDNLIRLETELYRYQPDVLLLYHGHNELFAALNSAVRGGAHPGRRGSTPGEIRSNAAWRYWLSRHSLLYTKLAARWRATRSQRAGHGVTRSETRSDVEWRVAIDSGAAAFRRDLRAFLALARAHGLSVVLAENVHVSFPQAATEPDSSVQRSWQLAVPATAPEVVLAGYQRYNAILREEGTRLDVPVISTTGFGLWGKRWYFEGDPIHFNDAGAERMAAEMGRALLNARLVPAR